MKAKTAVETVISAARACRTSSGDCPESLDRLAPEFISALPSHMALQYNKTAGVIGFIYSPSTLWGGTLAGVLPGTKPGNRPEYS